jgi:hypothetical protein
VGDEGSQLAQSGGAIQKNRVQFLSSFHADLDGGNHHEHVWHALQALQVASIADDQPPPLFGVTTALLGGMIDGGPGGGWYSLSLLVFCTVWVSW